MIRKAHQRNQRRDAFACQRGTIPNASSQFLDDWFKRRAIAKRGEGVGAQFLCKRVRVCSPRNKEVVGDLQ